MQVRQLKKILTKVVEILEIYDAHSLEEMLDDILLKTTGKKKKKRNKAQKEKIVVDFDSLQNTIQKANSREEIIDELSHLEKSILIEFGKFINIKVDKRDNKISIARTIAGHVSFSKLNEKISQRERFPSTG